jgi:hypothetical protein
MFALLQAAILKLDPSAVIIPFVPKLHGPQMIGVNHAEPPLGRGYALEVGNQEERKEIAEREAAYFIARSGLGRRCALRTAEENGIGTIVFELDVIAN